MAENEPQQNGVEPISEFDVEHLDALKELNTSPEIPEETKKQIRELLKGRRDCMDFVKRLEEHHLPMHTEGNVRKAEKHLEKLDKAMKVLQKIHSKLERLIELDDYEETQPIKLTVTRSAVLNEALTKLLNKRRESAEDFRCVNALDLIQLVGELSDEERTKARIPDQETPMFNSFVTHTMQDIRMQIRQPALDSWIRAVLKESFDETPYKELDRLHGRDDEREDEPPHFDHNLLQELDQKPDDLDDDDGVSLNSSSGSMGTEDGEEESAASPELITLSDDEDDLTMTNSKPVDQEITLRPNVTAQPFTETPDKSKSRKRSLIDINTDPTQESELDKFIKRCCEEKRAASPEGCTAPAPSHAKKSN